MKQKKLKFTLSDCKAIFHKSFHLEDDRLIDIAAAVYAANLLGADPLWFMIIGPPSNTKTEILQCFAGHPQAVFLSTLTPNTLVSGFKTKDGFNPSLLPKLKDKLLVLKDFTSVLSMRQESRTEVIGQLREAYDGKYDKGYGNGVTINWTGKFGFLGACTNEYDDHHAVIASMGERFLLYRTRNRDNGAMGLRAHEMVGCEDEIRKEVREAFQKFIAQFDDLKAVSFREDKNIITAIISLACFVAIARTPVKRDYRGEVKPVLFHPEGSGRLTKQLKQLGMAIMGHAGRDMNVRYDTIDDADLLAAVDRLEAHLIPANVAKKVAKDS
jgi:hypothetical protein